MVVLGRALRADVLPERSPKGNVQHLRAAADREDWLVGLERPACEQQLRAVELLVHLDCAIVARRFAVELRLDVRATREAQAVAEVEELAQPRVGQRRADAEWRPARSLERVEIRAVASEVGGESLLMQHPQRDADQRSVCHWETFATTT